MFKVVQKSKSIFFEINFLFEKKGEIIKKYKIK